MTPPLLAEFHVLLGAVQDHLDNLPERVRRLPHAITLAEVAEHALSMLAIAPAVTINRKDD